MWLKVNLSSVGLGTSCVYCKSPRSLSHSKAMCLLTLAIAFYLLWWNWARGLLKTHAFITTWSWTFRPYSQVNGRPCLPGSMVTLWHAHKCCTISYLDVYDASHPSTLQTNLGPSLAGWTLSMAIVGGATIFMATPSMATKGKGNLI
jgi:hypothetical protein